MEGILKIVKGNVELYNINAQRVRIYYSKGDAVRADWYNQKEGSIQVQLADGKVLIINRNCQIIRRF
jgi:hypothetical protein